MKLLRNPWVTGALVLAAVAVIAFQFMPSGGLHLNWFRANPAPAPAASSAAPQAKAAAATRNNNASRQFAAVTSPGARTDGRIDRQYVATHFVNWVNSPLRDPFLLLDTAKDSQALAGETNSPVATWKLNGIWHQDGSELAIINNHIYKEGDEIVQGYTLERIEGSEVWFQGPNRKERLGFRELGRFGETNQPPNSSQPKEPRPRP